MYLQFHSVKEPSENHDMWVWVLFSSLRGRVRFSSHSCTFITFGFGLVLGKIWVLLWSCLAAFGFVAISSKNGETERELRLLY